MFFNNENIYVKKFSAMDIADLAVNALLYEVSITPKAGLVSRFSNGSHSDMNFYTFLDSAISLRKYFFECFQHNEKYKFESEDFFKNLRLVGKKAEEKMFRATNKINTHKGTIFSMGILIAVLSVNMKEENFSLTELRENIKKMCKPLEEELGINLQNTNGEKIYQKYKIKGARGLALSGYSVVLDDGIKKLYKFLERLDLETACILLLFYYMSVLDDTNIITRSNVKVLEEVKRVSANLYEKNIKTLEKISIKSDMSELNDSFIKKNISPGGSADLLILTIFLYFLTR